MFSDGNRRLRWTLFLSVLAATANVLLGQFQPSFQPLDKFTQLGESIVIAMTNLTLHRLSPR